MSIIEKIVRIIAPHRCLGCDSESDILLCEACVESIGTAHSCCYRCQAPTRNYTVCERCAPRAPLRQVLARVPYERTAKDLVHRLKFERAQSAADEIASLIAQRLPCLPPNAVIVHVPTATRRVRMRGYDHARLIAKKLAGLTGTRHCSALVRIGQRRQVGASRTERLRQLQSAFRVVNPSVLRGRHVVLVDDVMTTGATLEAAARTLQRAGIARVSAAVFARA